MELKELDSLLQKAQAVKKLLDEKPEVLTFLQLLKDTDSNGLVEPMRLDPVVPAGVAAKALGVSRKTLYQYVKQGILKPYWTLGSNRMKFKVSDINALPQRGEPT